MTKERLHIPYAAGFLRHSSGLASHDDAGALAQVSNGLPQSDIQNLLFALCSLLYALCLPKSEIENPKFPQAILQTP